MDKLSLQPPLAGDERFTRLANLAAERFAQLDLTALLIYLVDLVDTSALPSLAEQFHVQGLEGWLFARDERQKRDLIKQAIELHRYRGTPWAVRQVLKILALDGDISEWFEYGGDPYFFRMDVTLETRGLTEDEFNALIVLIHEYKNVRSTLEMLTIWLINQSQIPVIASAIQGGEIATVLPLIVESVGQSSAVYLATGCLSAEMVMVLPPLHEGVEQAQSVSVGTGCWSIEFVTVYPEE
ncbi:phage tail protein I [Salmonella enterica]|uniref:phage tail protein I n=1 Tax=Salmonella enterica TaxID=28901 RepID=UPI0009588592|nr:phage tail protein I [Salmonella enterica]APV88228.1 phage tail protein I [Salmonella enterica subsp. enterica serovar Mbandaka str. ATCC 51958]EBF8302843.1 phage tail protein I [Salmonella enterica subsp. enterica serovar Mbandaka]